MITLPESVLSAFSDFVGKDFAFSYFSRARLFGGVVKPATQTAYERIKQNQAAMDCLKRAGLTLAKPEQVRQPAQVIDLSAARRAPTTFADRSHPDT